MKGDLDLESAREMFEKMRDKFPQDYRYLEMPYMAMTIVVPLLKKRLQDWSPMTAPHMHMDDFIQWKSLLQLQSNAQERRQTEPMDPFHNLLWESWMPSIRVAITSWNPQAQ